MILSKFAPDEDQQDDDEAVVMSKYLLHVEDAGHVAQEFDVMVSFDDDLLLSEVAFDLVDIAADHLFSLIQDAQ